MIIIIGRNIVREYIFIRTIFFEEIFRDINVSRKQLKNKNKIKIWKYISLE